MSKHSDAIDMAIIKAVTAAGRNGITTADVPGFNAASTGNACRRLKKDGRIFCGRIGYRTLRFFAMAPWAAEYEGCRASPATVAVARTSNRAQWAPDATATRPMNPDGTPAYKFTQCPPVQRRESDPIRTANYIPY